MEEGPRHHTSLLGPCNDSEIDLMLILHFDQATANGDRLGSEVGLLDDCMADIGALNTFGCDGDRLADAVQRQRAFPLPLAFGDLLNVAPTVAMEPGHHLQVSFERVTLALFQ